MAGTLDESLPSMKALLQLQEVQRLQGELEGVDEELEHDIAELQELTMAEDVDESAQPWETDGWEESREDEATSRLLENAKGVPEFWKRKYRDEARRFWDIFYKENTTNFFKDRHYLHRDFAREFAPALRRPWFLLEFGCGVGNAFFPLLEVLPHLRVFAFDLSPRAIDFARGHRLYEETGRVHAFVCDATREPLPPFADPHVSHRDVGRLPVETLPSASTIADHDLLALKRGYDVALMLFMLSACAPDQMLPAFVRAAQALRPGGMLLFRDYGRYDEAQLRFRGEKQLAENFFVRQDGTQSYFFSIEDLESLARAAGLEVVECRYLLRRYRNRAQDVSRRRVFVHGRFRKPIPEWTRGEEAGALLGWS